MDTTKPAGRNVGLCIKLSEKASRRQWRWCWNLTHNCTHTRILSCHFPIKYLQISQALLLLGLEIQTEELWPLHMVISVNFTQPSQLTANKGFGCFEWVLAAVGFDGIEFILFYTPLIFGYMCIAFVIFCTWWYQIWLVPLVQIPSVPLHRHPYLIGIRQGFSMCGSQTGSISII